MCCVTYTMARYVLKDKDTGEVLFVVAFTLLPKDLDDEGGAKSSEPGKSNASSSNDSPARSFEPKAEDLD